MRELSSLIPYLKRYIRVYLVGFGCVVGSNLLTTLAPRFLQQGIDALTTANPMPQVQRAAFWLVAAAVAGGVLRYGMRQLLNGVSRRVEYDLRNDLFHKLLSLPAAYYDKTPTGDLMARATNDLLAVRMIAGPAVMYLLDTVTRAAIMVPAMLAVDRTLAGLALAPLVVLPVLEGILGRRIHTRTLAIQEHFGRLTDFVRQNISAARIVRAYNQETPETDAFARLNEDYAAKNLHLAKAQAALDPLLAFLGALSSMMVLWAGGRLVIAGQVTTGEFVSFFVYLALLVWPLIFLGWVVNLVARGTAALIRINAVFREPNSLPDPAVPAVLPPGRPARSVRFDGVWFRYPEGPDRGYVLQDLTLEVPAGQSLGIVGATGSGKSALADLLVRGYDPSRGAVLIDGIDLRHLPLAEVRRQVGLVPQETFLFSETLKHNVLLGAPDDGRLARVADVSALAAAIGDLPKGFETILGERGINLSGGQRQRAAIARALAQDPPIIVLDDALSAVDSETEARILDALRGALVGKTSIVISHRAAAVRTADEIVVLDRGRVVERGRYEELLGRGGRFADLVRTQLLEAELERM
ncbi:MAG: ABC transporter ATP-binding protein [Gemmatimonadales bacterium]